jgi:hypothetical protein
MSETDPGFLAAVEEAKQGFAEGGVPIGIIFPSLLPSSVEQLGWQKV